MTPLTPTHRSSIYLALLLTATLVAAQAAPPANLLVNGDLQKLDARGWAVGWARSGDMQIVREGDQTRLVVKSGAAGQTLNLDPTWARLKITCRMKTTDVVLRF